jgi:DNA-binding response OmpR family regulator
MTRVLVVEQEPALRLLYRVNLEAEQMEVLEAADGPNGLLIANGETPDLVLLGVMMPRLDGWQVAEQLREDPRTRHIPFVFVTARSRYRDRLRGFELGAADYMTLPVDPFELAPRIRAILGRTPQELAAASRERIAEMKKWIQHEEDARVRLRDLLEEHASEIFGSGVERLSDASDMQMLRLWLTDGSEWRITLEPIAPPSG